MLYLAYRNPRGPWYARLFTAFVVGYAFSPVDLIPDPIPILGYLDDLVLVPLGIMLVVRMTPPDVLAECRAESREVAGSKPVSRVVAVVVIVVWVSLAVLAVYLVTRW